MEPPAELKDETQKPGLDDTIMKLKVFRQPSQKNGLQEVIAKIIPLPRDIGPSQRFLQQMRQRLLQLQEPGPSRRAA